jgi:hypothetical protein
MSVEKNNLRRPCFLTFHWNWLPPRSASTVIMATSLSFLTMLQVGRLEQKGVVFFTPFSTWTQISRFFLRRSKQQQKQKTKLFPLYTGAAVSVPSRDVQQQAVHCQNRLWNSAHSRLEREEGKKEDIERKRGYCERCY